MSTGKEVKKEEPNDENHHEKWVDLEKVRFSLNIAAIIALIVTVFQFTNFTWSSYHELERRIHTIEIKYNVLDSGYNLLDEKFKHTVDRTKNTESKLNEIEGFIKQVRSESGK